MGRIKAWAVMRNKVGPPEPVAKGERLPLSRLMGERKPLSGEFRKDIF